MGSFRGREAQERLHTLYARTPGPVVFVDESFRPAGNSYGERPFYTMSGVTIPKESLEGVRKELERIIAADYWHTTEAYAGKLGPVEELRPRILELNQYLAQVGTSTSSPSRPKSGPVTTAWRRHAKNASRPLPGQPPTQAVKTHPG
ncbi:hypothetical protein [Paenarthrobacter sp. YIM B13468]|uniref:hypothetical protein n=1 Tax=Paenarthrobacter sp. YIM B13468 TaxID=3366295 RepID=UPI0036713FFC